VLDLLAPGSSIQDIRLLRQFIAAARHHAEQ
jgi:hypothetical protein